MPFLRALVCVLFAACSKSEPAAPSASQPASQPAAHQPAAKPSKDPARARELLAAGAVVLDVRTPEEYADDHLPNAVNIPVQDFASRIDEVAKLVANDKAKPIVVYCAAGRRAARAKEQLDGAGYSQVVNGGGLDDLR